MLSSLKCSQRRVTAVTLETIVPSIASTRNHPRSISTNWKKNHRRQYSSSSSSSSSCASSCLGRAALIGGVAAGVLLAVSLSDHVYAAPAVASTTSHSAPSSVVGPSASTLNVDYKAVRSTIADLLDAPDYDDGSRGPLFVRLAWHSAGSYSKLTGDGGSNGAAIRFPPEKDWGGNKGLQIAVAALEEVKKKHPGISYGDLYTLAGVVAIEEMGGPTIPWRPGRIDYFDGKKSPGQDNRLPDGAKAASHLRDVFYRMGFSDQEIVALSGAHALGRCHTDRSGYSGPWTRAPTTFSNEYFRLLLEEYWTEKKWSGPRQFENSRTGGDLMMLPADVALIQDPALKVWVEKYAADESLFFRDFAAAFSKLLELGVKFESPDGSITVTEAKPKSWWSSFFPSRGNKSGHN